MIMKCAEFCFQMTGAHACAPSGCSSACGLGSQLGRARKGPDPVGLAAIMITALGFDLIISCLLGQRQMLRYGVCSLKAIRMYFVELQGACVHATKCGPQCVGGQHNAKHFTLM